MKSVVAVLLTMSVFISQPPQATDGRQSLPATQATEGAGRTMDRQISITFDDLPYVGAFDQDSLSRATRVTETLVDVIARRQVPVIGFVNESKLYRMGEIDARVNLLARWVEAGAVLGNHSFSHADFNVLSVEEYREEIVRGDIISRQLMQKHDPQPLFFRFPYTHVGDTAEKKASIARILGERGYRIAPHTVDSEDYTFNRAFVLSQLRGDADVAHRVCGAYADFVLAATIFGEAISVKLFSREIPQTLLIHSNEINAACLEDVLRRLAERGYRFVSLEDAMRDPAYQSPETFVTSSGPTWFWRWMKSGSNAVSFRGDPEAPQWVVDLAGQSPP